MALLSVGNSSEETVHMGIEGEEAVSCLEKKRRRSGASKPNRRALLIFGMNSKFTLGPTT